MNDERYELIEDTIAKKLKKAQYRRNCPNVLKALFSLGFTETRMAEILETNQPTISYWVTGVCPVPPLMEIELYRLLQDAKNECEGQIFDLKEDGLWDG